MDKKYFSNNFGYNILVINLVILGTQVAPRGTTVQVVHTEFLARMPNLVADSDTENPPYLCGFRKMAS